MQIFANGSLGSEKIWPSCAQPALHLLWLRRPWRRRGGRGRPRARARPRGHHQLPEVLVGEPLAGRLRHGLAGGQELVVASSHGELSLALSLFWELGVFFGFC